MGKAIDFERNNALFLAASLFVAKVRGVAEAGPYKPGMLQAATYSLAFQAIANLPEGPDADIILTGLAQGLGALIGQSSNEHREAAVKLFNDRLRASINEAAQSFPHAGGIA